MEELIKRLERVIQTGAPDKDGQHPISAETVLEVVKQLSEHGTNLAEVGTDAISRQSVIDMLDETKRIARQNIDGAVLMTFERVFDSLVNITNALPTIQPKKRGMNIEQEKMIVESLPSLYPMQKFEEDAIEVVLDALPSAEPKRGKWIDKGITGDWQYQTDGRGRSWHEWQCDQCKDMVKKRSFYCPNCGAKMEVTT